MLRHEASQTPPYHSKARGISIVLPSRTYTVSITQTKLLHKYFLCIIRLALSLYSVIGETQQLSFRAVFTAVNPIAKISD